MNCEQEVQVQRTLKVHRTNDATATHPQGASHQ
jgi:hypothetical protein